MESGKPPEDDPHGTVRASRRNVPATFRGTFRTRAHPLTVRVRTAEARAAMAREVSTTTDRSASEAERVNNPRPIPTLTVVAHPDDRVVGARRAIGAEPLELGRDSEVFGPGALDHRQISRRHLRLSSEGFSLRIEDRESRNGTLLNGVVVQTARAKPGDIIELGPVLLLYHLTSDEVAAESKRMVGTSSAMAQLWKEIERVAPSATTVLVLGETGTGKELVSRELHDRSGRSGEFVATNCGSLTDSLLQSVLFGHERGAFSGAVASNRGLFEAAHGGTLLLDEIGDASPMLQTSLLRVLQEHEVRRIGATKNIPVDVRVIAATHRDLPALVRAGTFREDLYARLSQWVIRVPPLRDRREDIPRLARAQLAHLREARTIHRSAMLALLRAHFPRNVRQLEATIERIVRSASPHDPEIRLTPEAATHLAEAGRGDPSACSSELPPNPAQRPKIARDRASLQQLLRDHNGNVTHMARQMSVGRNTLYRWLREARISLDTLRENDD